MVNSKVIAFDCDKKACSGCKQHKELDQFHKDKTLSSGLASRCKSCIQEYHRARYIPNSRTDEQKALAREKNYLRRYGITIQEYNEMFVAQEGSCGICETHVLDLKQNHLFVDHNHETGEVRELLCSPCNLNLIEDVDLLEKQIKYIKRNSKENK